MAVDVGSVVVSDMLELVSRTVDPMSETVDASPLGLVVAAVEFDLMEVASDVAVLRVVGRAEITKRSTNVMFFFTKMTLVAVGHFGKGTNYKTWIIISELNSTIPMKRTIEY